MNGQKTPGTVFVDDSVDTRAPTRSPDAPVSSGDIIGANWTLSYQDMAGQPLQAKIDAYTPLINELDKRDTRTWAQKIFGPQYLTAATAGLPINTNKVWGDIARIRATDPGFLKDIPATNDAEFDAWVKAGEKGKRTQAQDVVRREQGLGQKALGFGTGVVSSFADPINLAGMALTGPIAGGGKTLLSTMARDAVVNMAIETAELPSISSNRAQFGETMTPLEMAGDVGTAGVAGGLFPVATRGAGVVGSAIANPLGDAVAPVARSTQQFFAPWALGRANIDIATDAEIAREFANTVPRDARTPDAQAGLYVLDREAEVRGASPYAPNPGGLDANAEKLARTSDTLSQPASVGRAPKAAPAPSRSTVPITQSNIIHFVLNDLEGGAKVVPFSQADGGTTKYGIAKKFNPEVDVANISEADAAGIARRKYWLPEFNTADPRIAAIGFDANWISSPSLARRIIRESGGDVDKAIGIYREALNRIADTVSGKEKFRKGWNNRVDKLARFVGDAESSTVRLQPEAFNGDDVAYRAQMEDLNREELRLSDDTPSRPDPVRDYVDRVAGGENVSSPEDVRFAADNQPAIAAETALRAENGTDGSALGGYVAPPIARDPNAGLVTTVFHGSPHQFEKFSTDNIGSGEGAQAFGWGLYFAENKKIAEHYRQTLAKDHAFPSMSDAGKDVMYQYVRDAGGDWAKASKAFEKFAKETGFRDPEIGDALRAGLPGSLHEVQIPNIDAYLHWDKPLGEQSSSVRSALADFGVEQGETGAVAYGRLADALGGQREASAALADRGVLGVKYFDGKSRRSGAGNHNYVIFDDSHISTRLPEAPPSLDPKTYGVDTPHDAEARLLADSAYHDVKALADVGDTTKAQLVEGGEEMTAAKLIESLDRDQSAIDAIKGCL